MKSRVILKESPWDLDLYPTFLMDFQINPDVPKLVTLYNLEQFSKRIQTDKKSTTDKNSTIRKLIINLENLESSFI